MRSVRFAEILEALAEQDVEFIVVGMTAGILHGAPVTTVDVHIVHRRTDENVARLLRALEALNATYRHDTHDLRQGLRERVPLPCFNSQEINRLERVC